MAVTVLRGDARRLPLADACVDLVVTSPPYMGLRSYRDGGEHYPGQIGGEATPAEFVDALVEVTQECMRVLKPSGSIFINLGDKYASSGGHGASATSQLASRTQYVEQTGRVERNTSGIATKSLMGLPWRYALRCIDELGLILRRDLIWSKPNGLPESVTDRCRSSHEYWFHFTLNPRYYSAVDEIREPHVGPVVPRRLTGGAPENEAGQRFGADGSGHTDGHPLGKLPGSVWTIATEPLRVPDHLGIGHFAAFPTEWPKRIIKGWSPAGVCVECGFGLDTDFRESLTCPNCGGDSFRPSIIADPFGGTGTTAHVADALGRHGITLDMSADYCRIAGDDLMRRRRHAKVHGLTRPVDTTETPGLF